MAHSVDGKSGSICLAFRHARWLLLAVVLLGVSFVLAREEPPAKEITNSLGMKMVLIPAGKFTMGSPNKEAGRADEEIAHEVEITRPFYLGVFEVTQEEFETVMKQNPSAFAAKGNEKDKVKGLDTKRFP